MKIVHFADTHIGPFPGPVVAGKNPFAKWRWSKKPLPKRKHWPLPRRLRKPTVCFRKKKVKSAEPWLWQKENFDGAF